MTGPRTWHPACSREVSHGLPFEVVLVGCLLLPRDLPVRYGIGSPAFCLEPTCAALIIAAMNDPAERVLATNRIDVTAHQVFLTIADPASRVGIDGSDRVIWFPARTASSRRSGVPEGRAACRAWRGAAQSGRGHIC